VTKTTRVYPSASLNTEGGEYLPGVGIDGADLPEDEARELIERGLARRTRPAVEDITPQPEPTAPSAAEES
jgi:hypothetical protein